MSCFLASASLVSVSCSHGTRAKVSALGSKSASFPMPAVSYRAAYWVSRLSLGSFTADALIATDFYVESPLCSILVFLIRDLKSLTAVCRQVTYKVYIHHTRLTYFLHLNGIKFKKRKSPNCIQPGTPCRDPRNSSRREQGQDKRESPTELGRPRKFISRIGPGARR